MISALIVLSIASTLFSLTTRYGSGSSTPARAAMVGTVGALVLAGASTGVLALITWYGVARVGPVAAVGGWSSTLLSQRDPLPVWQSVSAGSALAAICVSLVRYWLRQIGEWRTAHAQLPPAGRGGVAVIDDERVGAFALDGPFGRRVVVTTGLLTVIDDDGMRLAVIEHERSHLRHHHLLYRVLTESAARANPLLRPMVPTVDGACEAWADDDAAAATNAETVAAAVASVALTRSTVRVARSALALATTPVVSRVERLLAPRCASNIGLVPAVVLSSIAAAVLAVACRRVEVFFELLRLGRP